MLYGTAGHQPPLDPGAQTMKSTAALGEAGTLATAQILNGLSGMLMSAGLTELLRDLLGTARPGSGTEEPEASAGDSEGGASPRSSAGPVSGEGAELAGMGASILKEMVVQGMVGRILALNAANTYLSLATSEQLRQWGAQITDRAAAATPAATAQVSPVAPAAYPVSQTGFVPPQWSPQPLPMYWGQQWMGAGRPPNPVSPGPGPWPFQR